MSTHSSIHTADAVSAVAVSAETGRLVMQH